MDRKSVRSDKARRMRAYRARMAAMGMPQRISGPPLADNWRERFLAEYEVHGTLYKAARRAGIDPKTVTRHRDVEPEFDQACKDAFQLAADRYEEDLADQARETGNPVGYIVRLKAMRPAEYIEKQAMLNVSLKAELDPVDASALLRAMMGSMTGATRAAFEQIEAEDRQHALPPAPE